MAKVPFSKLQAVIDNGVTEVTTHNKNGDAITYEVKHYLPFADKLELVSKVIAGRSITSVAFDAGINDGMLYQWVRKYKLLGYNGLVNQKKGRKSNTSDMKKINYNNPRKINESEYEELIRLRAENEYIKAENEVMKAEMLEMKAMLQKLLAQN